MRASAGDSHLPVMQGTLSGRDFASAVLLIKLSANSRTLSSPRDHYDVETEGSV
jgi:hypothetical protein